MTAKPPITFAAIPPEWIAAVRKAASDHGQPLRAHATLPIVEAKSMHTNLWMPLMLHGSGTTLVSAEDRDLLLKALQSNP
jgi:hypothetical protein